MPVLFKHGLGGSHEFCANNEEIRGFVSLTRSIRQKFSSVFVLVVRKMSSIERIPGVGYLDLVPFLNTTLTSKLYDTLSLFY